MAGVISAVAPRSIAAELDLAPGDKLLCVNGQPVQDIIDYDFLLADEEALTLLIEKTNGETWELEIEKEAEEELGISFAANVFDGIRPCRNHCIFCFIDQLQPAPRRSLLLKDDDYRMSFLEGNFITGTNLREADLARIAALRLTPLYVSVHSTDEDVRALMLGCKKPAPILPLLRRLIDTGAQIHTQIVLCPEINDGALLQQTVADLAALYPGVASIAVVPVGLTRFQPNPRLRLYSRQEAADLLDTVTAWQRDFQARYGTSLVFAADELYVKAARPFPPAAHYENFDQIENGVGLASRFLAEWQECRSSLPAPTQLPKTGIVTGVTGWAVLQELEADLQRLSQGQVEIIRVENSFYGPLTTATGLLTGSCLQEALPRGVYSRLLIPTTMLKFDEAIFLDDCTLPELEQALQTPVQAVPPQAAALLQALFSNTAANSPEGV